MCVAVRINGDEYVSMLCSGKRTINIHGYKYYQFAMYGESKMVEMSHKRCFLPHRRQLSSIA